MLWCWQTRAIFDGQHRCLAIHAILQVYRKIFPIFFPVMLTQAWQKMLKKNAGCWCQTYVLLTQRKFPFQPSISGPFLSDTCCDIDLDWVTTTELYKNKYGGRSNWIAKIPTTLTSSSRSFVSIIASRYVLSVAFVAFRCPSLIRLLRRLSIYTSS